MKICKKCKAVNISKALYCKFCNSNIKNADKASLFKSLENALRKKDKKEPELEDEKIPEAGEKASIFKKLLPKKEKLLEKPIEDKIKNFGSSTENKASLAPLPQKTFPDLVKVPSNLIENDEDLSKINFDEAVKSEAKLPQNNLVEAAFVAPKDDKELLKNIAPAQAKKTKPVKAKKNQGIDFDKKEKKSKEVDIKLNKKEGSLFFKIVDLLSFLLILILIFLLIYYLKEDLYLLEDIYF